MEVLQEHSSGQSKERDVLPTPESPLPGGRPGLAGLSAEIWSQRIVAGDSAAEAINPNANPRDARHHGRSESGSYE